MVATNRREKFAHQVGYEAASEMSSHPTKIGVIRLKWNSWSKHVWYSWIFLPQFDPSRWCTRGIACDEYIAGTSWT